MKKALATIVLLIVLIGCSSPSSETITETVEVKIPVTVEVIEEVEVTRQVEVEVTRIVEVTREVIVEVTPEPTSTPVPEEINTEDAIALNDVAEVENGGLTIQIARVIVANKDAIPQDFSYDSSFDNVDVVGELIFVVTNNSDQTISVYPDQGSVQINSELVELFDFFLAGFGDDISGDIPPGVTLYGGQWFGINRSEVSEIQEMTVRFSGPVDSESFSRLGEDFEIVIDLSERVFEPISDELLEVLD